MRIYTLDQALSMAAAAASTNANSAISALHQHRTASRAAACGKIYYALENAALAAMPKEPRPKLGRLILRNEGESVTYRGRHSGRTHTYSRWAVQFQCSKIRQGCWIWDDSRAAIPTGLSAAAGIGPSALAAGYTLSEQPQAGKRPTRWLATRGADVALIGFVARGGGTDYHADSEDQAITGLAAKIAKLAALAASRDEAKLAASRIKITAAEISEKFGFCASGIAATAVEIGLDPGGRYTPAEIIAAAAGRTVSSPADFGRFTRYFGAAK